MISFDEWKRKKEHAAAFTSVGHLREDVSMREEYGFDLCIQISEEKSSAAPDEAHLDKLWHDLHKLMRQLPQEHAYYYFKAFDAFWKKDEKAFFDHLDLFFASEKRLYHEVSNTDWWIDCFIWVFTPAFPGMYRGCSELFFKYWPLCAMGWVCEALEQEQSSQENVELELDLLMLAIQADPDCYLAHYLIASIYYDQKQWKSSLPFFKKASISTMHGEDPAFYFDYAWAAEKAGRLEQALSLYQTCLSLDDMYPCAINNLGCVLLRMKKYDQALKEFRRAINLNLDGALPYRNMVTALERQGKIKECITFIESHISKLGKHYEIELLRLQLLNSSIEKGDSKTTTAIHTPTTVEMEPASENLLPVKQSIENWLENQIESGQMLFGRSLRIYEDQNGYGRHYYVAGTGRIDFLCYDNQTNDLCVIGVFSGTANERALIRMWQQIHAVRKTIAKNWQRVCGYIVCEQANDTLKSSLKTIQHEDVNLYEYRISLTEFTPL